MGYGDTRANKSRVHTRIINSGSGGKQQCRTITIWRTESGLRWGPRSGFDSKCWYGDGCPGRWVGVVSPKCPSRDNAWVHNQCSVQGSSDCLAVQGTGKTTSKECWRSHRRGFSVFLGLGMRQTRSWGHCTGSIALWVIGISQEYLKGVTEHNTTIVFYNVSIARCGLCGPDRCE